LPRPLRPLLLVAAFVAVGAIFVVVIPAAASATLGARGSLLLLALLGLATKVGLSDALHIAFVELGLVFVVVCPCGGAGEEGRRRGGGDRLARCG